MSRSIATRPLTVILLLLSFGLVSAYAQDENKTEKEKPESSREALVLYAEAASYQNNEQFDLAGAEWAKFLEKFPEDPRAIDARYNQAVCELQQKEFRKAVSNLTKVVATADEKFERLEDAYLNLGWCQYSVALENQPEFFAKATQTFKELLNKYPKGSFRDQALFFGGESLYLQGKFREAADSYAQLVEDETDSDLHSDAMYALGVTHEDMREFEAAGKIYGSFLKTYPDHDLGSEVQMRKAETVLQSGDFKTAAAIFGEVAEIKGFRSVDHARYRQAFCIATLADQLSATAADDPDWKQKRSKGYDQAASIFGSIATDMPDSPYAKDAAIAAGRAYYRARLFEKAGEWFARIKDSDSTHAPEAAHWLARILLEQKKPEEAREVVASVMKAAEKHPFLVSLKLDDADALYQNKETQAASVSAYLQISEDHNTHRLAPKALYNAAYGAMEIGEYKKGLEYANRFNERFAKHTLAPEVQKVIAECRLQTGDHDEAAAVYKQLADSGDKDGTRFELRRGLSLFLKKNYDEAIPVLQKVYDTTTIKDEKAEAAYWLGRSFARKKEFAKAIPEFRKSQEANPEWAQADEVLLNLARAQKRGGDVDAAISTINELLERFPESDVLDQAHYRLGEFTYAKNDYAPALTAYTKVIDTWPDSKLVPYSLYGRGWSQLRSGKVAPGITDFEQLKKQYPEHDLASQADYALGMALHQSGNHKDALASVESYYKSNPSGSALSDALYLEGLCQVGLNQHTDAIETFEAMLKQNPDYNSIDKVLYELAWAYKNSKTSDKALSTFTRLISVAPKSPLTAEAYYHVGENKYGAKDYNAAAEQYKLAGDMAASDDLKEKAAYKLGWAMYQEKDYANALTAFGDQLKIDDSSNLAADARFMRAECYFKQADFAQAFKEYELARKQPSRNETMQVLTLLHGGQAAAQQKEWKASSEWIAKLQTDFPNSAYLPQALYEQGWAQRNLGQLDAALQAFNQVTATSRNELGARSRFMIGEVLFEKKDYNSAILEFRRVMFGYGADKAPASIKRWQAKSAFEAGRCASVLAGQERNPQRRVQLIEGAKGFFQYVADKHASSTEADAAKEQLQRLQPGSNRISNRPAKDASGR